MNADVFGAQRRPDGGPPAGPFTFSAHGPRPIPRFPLLAEVDFPSYRFQQELPPGNLGVLVKVMADALSQPVDWRHGVGSGVRKTVIRIGSDHKLLSPCRAIGLVTILR